jgi:hypothetical protein
MTKKDALNAFDTIWAEAVEHDARLEDDNVAKCEAWNNYTDALCKERLISSKQYNTWSNPF